MSHSEVVSALDGHTWDPSTLYRNLIDLAEVGLLRRAELGDRTWRFEVSCEHGHSDQAAHFLCRECGDIACLPELVVTPSRQDSIPRALLEGQVELQVLGVCDECIVLP